ncbi:MAG: hypothetical protein Q6352_013585, partial [Candidatus Freyrarchaeum guaymaensis]
MCEEGMPSSLKGRILRAIRLSLENFRMFPQNLFWNVDRIAVFGRRAARYIVPLLNDPDPNVRKGLVQVLKRISA